MNEETIIDYLERQLTESASITVVIRKILRRFISGVYMNFYAESENERKVSKQIAWNYYQSDGKDLWQVIAEHLPLYLDAKGSAIDGTVKNLGGA